MEVSIVKVSGTPKELEASPLLREFLHQLGGDGASQPVAQAPGVPQSVASKPAQEEFIRRVLHRMEIPPGQRELFKALYEAGEGGLPYPDLAQAIGREESQLNGVVGALGRRIKGTVGFDTSVKFPIEVFFDISKVDGRWVYRLRPELRKVLQEEHLV